MSSTLIIAVYPGDRTEPVAELENSWLSAPLVWDFIAKRYLGMDWPALGNLEAMQKIWDKWKSPDVPIGLRVILMMTLDRLYVGSANYQRAAQDVTSGAALLPNPGHWPEIAKFMAGHQEIPGIGLWCTTVADNPWGAYEKDAAVTGLDWGQIFEIYAEIDSLAVAP